PLKGDSRKCRPLTRIPNPLFKSFRPNQSFSLRGEAPSFEQPDQYSSSLPLFSVSLRRQKRELPCGTRIKNSTMVLLLRLSSQTMMFTLHRHYRTPDQFHPVNRFISFTGFKIPS